MDWKVRTGKLRYPIRALNSAEINSGKWDWMERKTKLGEQKTHGKICGLFDEFFREINRLGKSNPIYQICCRQLIIPGKIHLLCDENCRQPARHGKSTPIYRICCRQFIIPGKIPLLYAKNCRQPARPGKSKLNHRKSCRQSIVHSKISHLFDDFFRQTR